MILKCLCKNIQQTIQKLIITSLLCSHNIDLLEINYAFKTFLRDFGLRVSEAHNREMGERFMGQYFFFPKADKDFGVLLFQTMIYITLKARILNSISECINSEKFYQLKCL